MNGFRVASAESGTSLVVWMQVGRTCMGFLALQEGNGLGLCDLLETHRRRDKKEIGFADAEIPEPERGAPVLLVFDE